VTIVSTRASASAAASASARARPRSLNATSPVGASAFSACHDHDLRLVACARRGQRQRGQHKRRDDRADPARHACAGNADFDRFCISAGVRSSSAAGAFLTIRCGVIEVVPAGLGLAI
jgi:hypothetical protein